MLRNACIAGMMLAANIAAAQAQEMQPPRISSAAVDWQAAAAELQKLEELQRPEAMDAANMIANLNQATGTLFSNIATSPIPVLLPFDTAAFLRDRAAGNPKKADDYSSGFRSSAFFFPGPSGYDAVFTIQPKEVSELGVRFSRPIDVQISGSLLLYELDEPTGMVGWPANGLETDFPGIRRLFLDSQVRYTFLRYGVPYIVSIECFDGGARERKVSCRDADKVAVRFLKALRLAGGKARPQATNIRADTIDRPTAQSTVFTYHSPGDIISGTGFKGKGGRVDYTVYSRMRFPLSDAPAFANSQSFMNWGDCDHTGRVSMGRRGNAAAYRCRVNSQPLVADESAADNYSYPWRDNFCEHRWFGVGQCPAGLGHQGQDIRPSSCKQRVEGSNRCEPYQHEVVAVRDGIVLRSPGQIAFYVVVNQANERVRVRYLHMFPKFLDRDGVASGRVVREGEVIGMVGTFNRHERGTTYHLHFDMQVPTKYGWAYVNPYTTLVAAYERLIHGRGREIRDNRPTAAAAATWGTKAEQASASDEGQNIVQSSAPDRIESPSSPNERAN